MTIHHSQVKQAVRLGGTLTESANNKGVFIATLGAQTFMAQSAKEALDKLIAAAGAKPAKKPKVGQIVDGKPTPGAGNIAAQEAKDATKPAKAPKKAKKKAAKRKSDEDEGEDGDDEEGTGKGSVVKAAYKKKYQPTHDTNGDEFTEAFRAATVDEADDAVDINKLNHVARDNGLKITQWMHLKNKGGGTNVGMIRMNLGNVLRGMVRNGTTVKIGTETFKGLPPKEKVKKPRAKKAAKAK